MTTTPVRPSRRALVHGAAWSVPVVTVAAAAPTFAASPCATQLSQTLDWDGAQTTFSRSNNNKSASATYDPDGVGPLASVTVNVAASYAGNMQAGTEFGGGTNPNLRVAPAVGGLGISGLALYQATTSDTPQGRTDRGTYTFTFTKPVTNLQFTLTDIDSASSDFWDVVQPSTGYTVVSQASGLSSDNDGIDGGRRFYRNVSNGPVDNTSGNAGNLTLRYAGPVTSFSITYWNGAASFDPVIDTDQVIYITDLTFDYKPC